MNVEQENLQISVCICNNFIPLHYFHKLQIYLQQLFKMTPPSCDAGMTSDKVLLYLVKQHLSCSNDTTDCKNLCQEFICSFYRCLVPKTFHMTPQQKNQVGSERTSWLRNRTSSSHPLFRECLTKVFTSTI